MAIGQMSAHLREHIFKMSADVQTKVRSEQTFLLSVPILDPYEMLTVSDGALPGHRLKGPRFVAIADTTESAASKMPCGACRQVMTEFGDPSMIIMVDGVGEFTLNDLQPSPFAPPRSTNEER